jgi:hypothetical protein
VSQSKPTASKNALSIDILNNLKKFNTLNQFETLIIFVKNDRVASEIIYEFSLLLQSKVAEEKVSKGIGSFETHFFV